jgi:hypothetical protein
MAHQLSVSVRNARADAVETAIGASPILRIRTGSPPANCAAARTGTILATIVLPSDWLANASNGQKSKSGVWEDTSADATGTAGHFEIMDSTGTICHWQGTISMSGGGGDMILDNTSIAIGQTVTITSFSWTEGNA